MDVICLQVEIEKRRSSPDERKSPAAERTERALRRGVGSPWRIRGWLKLKE